MFKNIKKYVINLKCRPDRLKSILNEFKYIGIDDVEIFEGIFTNSIEGCTRSHLSIIEKSLHENLDSVIIFEDDILFTEYAKTLINDIEKELNNINYSVLCLNPSIQRPINFSSNSKILLDVTKLPPKNIGDNEIYSTGFMLYKKDVFKPMLDNFILTEPFDVCLSSLIYPNYQTYSPFIPICYQSDSISNITQQQFSYQSKTDYWNKYSPINIPYSYFLGDIENRKHLDYKILKMLDK